MRSTLYSHSLVRAALTSAARTNGTVNGTTVDLGVFGNDFRSVLFVVYTATVTDGTHTISIQDSPDGSAWSAVDAAAVQGTAPAITSTADDTVYEFGYIPGTRQYVRLVAVTAGATTGGVFGAVAVLGTASSSPVARA